MKRRISFALLLVAALVTSTLPAGASTATLLSEKLIAGKPLLGIYGNLAYTTGSVVYTNIISEDTNSLDLYRYATATGVKKKVLETDGLELSAPQISGTRVVYSRIPKGSSVDQNEIYVRDFASSASGKESRITSSAAEQTNPDISGGRVVWQDYRDGNWDIYAYDLATGKESVVSTATGDQTYPSISGTKVVYADNRAGNWDIFVADIKTGKEHRLTSSPGTQSNPVISGSNVVYEEATGASTSIRTIKLGTDSFGNITASASRGLSIGTTTQYSPNISGNRVVWVYDSGTTSRLYLYDLSYGTRHKLLSGSSLIDSPQVSGSKIGYIKTDTKGASRVYLASLKVPKLTLSGPTKVAKGTTAKLSGRLTTSAGTAISKRTVLIEKSTDNKTWTLVRTLTSSSSGAYSYRTGAIKKTTYYRATYRGGDTYLSTRSAAKKIGLK